MLLHVQLKTTCLTCITQLFVREPMCRRDGALMCSTREQKRRHDRGRHHPNTLCAGIRNDGNMPDHVLLSNGSDDLNAKGSPIVTNNADQRAAKPKHFVP